MGKTTTTTKNGSRGQKQKDLNNNNTNWHADGLQLFFSGWKFWLFSPFTCHTWNGATQSCAMNSKSTKLRMIRHVPRRMQQQPPSPPQHRARCIYQCVSVCNTNTENALWLLIWLWAMRTVRGNACEWRKNSKTEKLMRIRCQKGKKKILIRRWSMFWWRLWFCTRRKNHIKVFFFFWDSFQIFLGVVLLEHKAEVSALICQLYAARRNSNEQSPISLEIIMQLYYGLWPFQPFPINSFRRTLVRTKHTLNERKQFSFAIIRFNWNELVEMASIFVR